MDNLVTALAAATDGDAGVVAPPPAKKARTGGKSKQDRLEQNRKAAIESRRRKKVMVSCVKLGHWAARTCLVMRWLLLTAMGMTTVLYSALSVCDSFHLANIHVHIFVVVFLRRSTNSRGASTSTPRPTPPSRPKMLTLSDRF